MKPIETAASIYPESQSTPEFSRRKFIHRAAGATFAAAILPTIIPASALGRNGAVAPGSRISVGVIGCGPQGQADMSHFLKEKDCQVVAVCDVKNDQLEQACKAVNGHYQNQDCRAYHDFRELVARPDIDACLIATPDHWHVLTALAAVNSGKDVYLEKPLAPTLAEGQALRAAVHRKKRVFQFGTQQRSGRLFRFACELARNNVLGRLQHINLWAAGSAPGGSREVVPVPAGWDYDLWTGATPLQPYTQDRCVADGRKTWYFISNYSLGFINGWGAHPMDIAVWGAGELMDGTVTAEARGNFRTAEGVCDTATIWEADYQFASGLTMKYVGVPNGHNNVEPTGEPFLHGEEWKQRYRRIELTHGTAFEGTDGWAHVDRSGINLQPETLIDIKPDSFKLRLTASAGHARNFLDCVTSRAETVCPVTAAVKGDTLCQVADIALRLERKVTFDFKNERFVNDEAADLRLKARPMRKPWRL